MTFLRSLAFNLAFPLWTIVMGVLLLPFLALPRNLLVPIVRWWNRTVLWLLAATTGLRHRVVGRENLPAGPCLIVSKHQSAWETFAFNLVLADPAFVLKRELFRIPIFGWYLAKMSMVGIDRKAGTKALKATVEGARARFAAGRPVVIFPQGTRTAPGERRGYLPGAYAIQSALGVPVVPVALDSGSYWGRQAFAKRSGTITMEILPPLPAGLDRRRFDAALQEAIETATARLEGNISGT